MAKEIDRQVVEKIKAMLRTLDKPERELVREIFAEYARTGDSDILRDVYRVVYEFRRPSMEEFIYGKYYLGLPKKSIYPNIMDVLVAADDSSIREVYLCCGKGSGKCVHPSTFVWSDRGLNTIGELIPKAGEQPDDSWVLTPSGMEQANARVRYKTVETIKITTRLGNVHEGTPDSKVWALGPEGTLGWVAFKDLTSRHLLKVHLDDADPCEGQDIQDHEAKLLGFIIGDGSVTTSYRVGIVTSTHMGWVEAILAQMGITQFTKHIKKRSGERLLQLLGD